jgi:hypothetical protein
VIDAAIPDAMLLTTDECFAQEVPEPVYDGLTCPKYALWDHSNPGSWLTKEQKSRLRFGGRRLLLLNDEACMALSSIYTGLVASGWLSKWGTTIGCKTSLMY